MKKIIKREKIICSCKQVIVISLKNTRNVKNDDISVTILYVIDQQNVAITY